MKDVVLAVDIGTSSLKAGLICQDGSVDAMTTIAYSAPENRFVAEGWIWALKAAVDKLVPTGAALRQAQGPRVVALAISGNGPTLVHTGRYRWSICHLSHSRLLPWPVPEKNNARSP